MNMVRKQKGVVAVEFGILLIPLVMLAFGITEFGRAMYQYNTIAKATRDATRYLSVKSSSDLAAKSAARCVVLYGKPATIIVVNDKPKCDTNAPPLIAGFTDVSKVVVTNKALQPIPGGGVASLVTVDVTGYTFVSLVSFVVPRLSNSRWSPESFLRF
jgi:Flp pilus assembly protein TadG